MSAVDLGFGTVANHGRGGLMESTLWQLPTGRLVTLPPRQLQSLAAHLLLGTKRAAPALKNHLTSLYRTLGAATAAEAAHMLGWLQIPDGLEPRP